MIHVIMGLKGSGKTKKLIDAINAAVADAHGDVVCIEYGKKLPGHMQAALAAYPELGCALPIY